MTTTNLSDAEIVTDTSALGQIERLPSLKTVNEALSYDAESGEFKWKARPGSHFKTKRHCSIWNARYANRVAGSPDKKGYGRIKIDGVNLLSHRVAWFIMTGSWPTSMIDHENGRPAINSFANLREADRSQNNRNSAIRKDNASGVKGVSWHKQARKWKAYIQTNNVNRHIGLFKTIGEAAMAVSTARNALHGSFANHG